jgi:hypothetical protein
MGKSVHETKLGQAVLQLDTVKPEDINFFLDALQYAVDYDQLKELDYRIHDKTVARIGEDETPFDLLNKYPEYTLDNLFSWSSLRPQFEIIEDKERIISICAKINTELKQPEATVKERLPVGRTNLGQIDKTEPKPIPPTNSHSKIYQKIANCDSLPDEAKELALSTIVQLEESDNTVYNLKADCLAGAFNWTDVPPGLRFWGDVALHVDQTYADMERLIKNIIAAFPMTNTAPVDITIPPDEWLVFNKIKKCKILGAKDKARTYEILTSWLNSFDNDPEMAKLIFKVTKETVYTLRHSGKITHLLTEAFKLTPNAKFISLVEEQLEIEQELSQAVEWNKQRIKELQWEMNK